MAVKTQKLFIHVILYTTCCVGTTAGNVATSQYRRLNVLPNGCNTTSVTTKVQCAVMCSSTPDCMAFTFDHSCTHCYGRPATSLTFKENVHFLRSGVIVNVPLLPGTQSRIKANVTKPMVEGSMIKVLGKVLKNDTDVVFTIDCCIQTDVALHIGFVSKNRLQFNTYVGATSLKRVFKTSKYDIIVGAVLDISILITSSNYVIYINAWRCCTYPHVLSFRSISAISVFGGVQILEFNF